MPKVKKCEYFSSGRTWMPPGRLMEVSRSTYRKGVGGGDPHAKGKIHFAPECIIMPQKSIKINENQLKSFFYLN